MDVLARICWIGLGGFLGANARYWLGAWVNQATGAGFPWGTLVVNVTGSFALGLLMGLLENILPTGRWWTPDHLRWLVAIGFLGAYTTFSTFEYETLKLLDGRNLLLPLGNIVLSVIVGFVAVWLGLQLGLRWVRAI